jgi:glutamyl/glutaminyl-tRNA synthetase
MLYNLFGWTPPLYCHLPLLLNPDRTKLSKRQNAASVTHFREKGYAVAFAFSSFILFYRYLPEALVNFVALMGWTPANNREILTMDELIAAFDLDAVNKSGCAVDENKVDVVHQTFLEVF